MQLARVAALVVAAGAAAGVVAGCAAGPNYHPPRITLPEHYDAAAQASPGGATEAAGGAPAIELAAWWRALQDPELDSLIERAVSGSPDLLIALDRLQAARTFEAAVIGTVLPEAGGSAGAGRGTGSDLTRGRVAPALHSADNATGLQHLNEAGGFDAVWELDIFGRYRR